MRPSIGWGYASGNNSKSSNLWGVIGFYYARHRIEHYSFSHQCRHFGLIGAGGKEFTRVLCHTFDPDFEM